MKARLTTLTPVHIGNGNTYNKNIDFIQSDKKIGIIDEKKVLKIIGENNIHQWVASINKGGNNFIELLKQRGWKDNDLESICSRIDNLKNKSNTSSQLKEAYRSPIKGLCIPGSSIKGALRTAILNSFLDEDNIAKLNADDLKTWKEKYDRTSGKIIRIKEKWSDAKIEKKIFGDNANEKSTRFLKVRDAHFDNVQADVFEVQILDKFIDGWKFKKGQQTLIETIPSKSVCEFDLFIDQILLNENLKLDLNEKRIFENNPSNTRKKYKLKWHSQKVYYLQNGIEGICSLVNEFTMELVRNEYNDLLEEKFFEGDSIIDKYGEIYDLCETAEPNEMILRVGGNSGYIFTTGKWVEKINLSDDDYNNLRKKIQKHDYSDMDFWPKTRKVTSGGNIFGFVKISFE